MRSVAGTHDQDGATRFVGDAFRGAVQGIHPREAAAADDQERAAQIGGGGDLVVGGLASQHNSCYARRADVSEASLGEERDVRDAEDRRTEVAYAAKRHILRHGLEATTLRSISREAGFTTGLISHHFPDKQALILACFETVSRDFISDAAERINAAAGAEDRVRALLDVAIPSSREEADAWRLWAEMWTYAGREPRLALTLIDTDARWEALVAEVFDEARVAGVFRADIDPEIEAANFVRLHDGVGLRAWLSGRWGRAREQLVHHFGTLASSPKVAARLAGDSTLTTSPW
jgi:AcrR family transcriptional regulator